jgi:hypothetical protein
MLRESSLEPRSMARSQLTRGAKGLAPAHHGDRGCSDGRRGV